MKIEIKEDINSENKIILSDDGLNNDNFVDLYVNDKEEITVNITDLLCAVEAFNRQRFLRLERDKLLE